MTWLIALSLKDLNFTSLENNELETENNFCAQNNLYFHQRIETIFAFYFQHLIKIPLFSR